MMPRVLGVLAQPPNLPGSFAENELPLTRHMNGYSVPRFEMSGPLSPAGTIFPVPSNAMLPPPTPNSSVSPSSSDSSSKKRKRSQRDSSVTAAPRTPSSIGAFSATTKDKVLALSNGSGCWHCGAPRTEICHVIGKKDIRVREADSQIKR